MQWMQIKQLNHEWRIRRIVAMLIFFLLRAYALFQINCAANCSQLELSVIKINEIVIYPT